MSAAIEKLLERAVLMLERLERVLPQPLSQPDWNEAIAWRYRKRASGPCLRHEPPRLARN